MATDSLIDQYLDALGGRVRGRRDRTELLDEVADHLHSAAERLEGLGVDPTSAQRRALARLGDPRLVATLITAVPSKGNIVSLFFSRQLGALSAASAILWIAASIAAFYGFTDLDGSWTPERYLLSAVLIATACVLTTAVLIGLNLRATGAFDGQTVTIAVLGLVASAVALVLGWAVMLWLPLLAIAVTWTMARAWRAHAGSRPFVVILLIAAPLIGIATITLTLISRIAGISMEFAGWAMVASMGAVLVAVLVDLTVRLARRVSGGQAVTA